VVAVAVVVYLVGLVAEPQVAVDIHTEKSLHQAAHNIQ
jgi:hypothetical protein